MSFFVAGIASAQKRSNQRRRMKSDLPIPEMPLAQEILGYLIRNPRAGDTLEGIVKWWLLEQKIHRSVADAQAALDELVKRKFVLAQETRDGKIHYRMNPEKKAGVRRRLNLGSSTRVRAQARRSQRRRNR